MREALFSTLESAWLAGGRHWADVRVVDAYAGSGALGLEALSRGAASVALIERDRRAAAVIRANIDAVGLPGAELVVAPLARAAAQPPAGAPAALLLLDPPYDVPAATVADEIAALGEHGWLEAAALAVVERPASDPACPFPDGWIRTAERRYGDTVLWYGRRGREEEHA